MQRRKRLMLLTFFFHLSKIDPRSQIRDNLGHDLSGILQGLDFTLEGLHAVNYKFVVIRAAHGGSVNRARVGVREDKNCVTFVHGWNLHF